MPVQSVTELERTDVIDEQVIMIACCDDVRIARRICRHGKKCRKKLNYFVSIILLGAFCIMIIVQIFYIMSSIQPN